jgi:tRNA threonylcarbamoyladenosine biosynthesis protein TsaE
LALTLELADHDATRALGRRLGELAPPGLLLRLDGPLGAGKTTLVQGVAEGLAVPPSTQVRSPSFALVRIHEGGRLDLVHVDLYRLGDPDELTELGLDDWFDAQSLVAVEWADRFATELPMGGLAIRLDYADHGGRDVRLSWVPADEQPDWLRRLASGGGHDG